MNIVNSSANASHELWGNWWSFIVCMAVKILALESLLQPVGECLGQCAVWLLIRMSEHHLQLAWITYSSLSGPSVILCFHRVLWFLKDSHDSGGISKISNLFCLHICKSECCRLHVSFAHNFESRMRMICTSIPSGKLTIKQIFLWEYMIETISHSESVPRQWRTQH